MDVSTFFKKKTQFVVAHLMNTSHLFFLALALLPQLMQQVLEKASKRHQAVNNTKTAIFAYCIRGRQVACLTHKRINSASCCFSKTNSTQR